MNVLGTLNLFESVKKLKEEGNWPQHSNITYASSAAVAGFHTEYNKSIEDDTHHTPKTHYGVFKIANEGLIRELYHLMIFRKCSHLWVFRFYPIN